MGNEIKPGLQSHCLLERSFIRVISYNILANSCIKEEFYPRADHNLLIWENRKKLLIDQINSYNADIICMQEVDEKDMYDFLKNNLTNYNSIFSKRGNGKLDGIATFYRAEKLILLQSEVYQMIDAKEVAVITKFQTFTEHNLTVINTKIKWVPEEKQKLNFTGLVDIEDMLLRKVPQNHTNTIVCGDFNANTESSVYQLMNQYHFKDVFLNSPYNTCNANNKAQRIDYFFLSENVSYKVHEMIGLANDTIVPSENYPSDHLPLIIDIY